MDPYSDESILLSFLKIGLSFGNLQALEYIPWDMLQVSLTGLAKALEIL